MIYIFLWFGFMILGLYGSIAVSFASDQYFGGDGPGALLGLLTLVVLWGLAFYNMHLGIKESLK